MCKAGRHVIGLWDFIARAEVEALITSAFLQAPSDHRVERIECLVVEQAGGYCISPAKG